MQCSIQVEHFVPRHLQSLSKEQIHARGSPIRKIAQCQREGVDDDHVYVDMRLVFDNAAKAASTLPHSKCYQCRLPDELATEKLVVWCYRQRRHATQKAPNVTGVQDTFVHWASLQSAPDPMITEGLTTSKAYTSPKSAKRDYTFVEDSDQDSDGRNQPTHYIRDVEVSDLQRGRTTSRARTLEHSKFAKNQGCRDVRASDEGSGHGMLLQYVPHPHRLLPDPETFRSTISEEEHSFAYSSASIKFSWLDPLGSDNTGLIPPAKVKSTFPRATKIVESRRNGHWIIPISQGMPWPSSTVIPAEPLWLSNDQIVDIQAPDRLSWTPERLKLTWNFLAKMHEKGELGRVHAACFLSQTDGDNIPGGAPELPEHIRVYVSSHLALACRRKLDEAGRGSLMGSLFQGKNLVWVDDELGCVFVA